MNRHDMNSREILDSSKDLIFGQGNVKSFPRMSITANLRPHGCEVRGDSLAAIEGDQIVEIGGYFRNRFFFAFFEYCFYGEPIRGRFSR